MTKCQESAPVRSHADCVLTVVPRLENGYQGTHDAAALRDTVHGRVEAVSSIHRGVK